MADLLPSVRQQLVSNLWKRYLREMPAAKSLTKALHSMGERVCLDHLAIVDLPGPRTGASVMIRLLKAIGYEVQGKSYLEQKQNEYWWLAEKGAKATPAVNAGPQIVVSDFRLSDCPQPVRDIVLSCTQQAPAASVELVEALAVEAKRGDNRAARQLVDTLTEYFHRRDWRVPSRLEHALVKESNELMAWAMVFGRVVNHFALAAHLLKSFSTLEQLNAFAEKLALSLQQSSGGKTIQGDKRLGVSQSAIRTSKVTRLIAGQRLLVQNKFLELIWRHSKKKNPQLWSDYFSGFDKHNADEIVHSLYEQAENF